jgi:hypothetical protein
MKADEDTICDCTPRAAPELPDERGKLLRVAGSAALLSHAPFLPA